MSEGLAIPEPRPTHEGDEEAVGESTEEEVRGVVTRDLAGTKWEVTAEPVLGVMQPDLLISDPGGENYVVEIKARPGSVHFGSVAQAAALQAAAIADLQEHVKAIVVFAGPDAEDLRAAGEDFGVDVLATESVDPVDIASLVTEHIRLLD